MIQKRISLALMFLFILWVWGIPLFSLFQIKKTVDLAWEEIASGKNRKEYVTFRLSRANISGKRLPREVVFSGIIHDVVSMREDGNEYIVTAYPDYKEQFWRDMLMGQLSGKGDYLWKFGRFLPVFFYLFLPFILIRGDLIKSMLPRADVCLYAQNHRKVPDPPPKTSTFFE